MDHFRFNETQKNVVMALGAIACIHLFITRSVLFYIPLFAGVLFFLWKKNDGKAPNLSQEEDPADWWKKGAPSEFDES
jgi:hypothetical protein